MTRHKDYIPPTEVCHNCNRKFVGDPPLCTTCASKASRVKWVKTASRHGKVVRRHRNNLATPTPHQDDLAILFQLACNSCSPEFLYRRVWEKQRGRCANRSCRRRNQTVMRIIPDPAMTHVSKLICQDCFKNRKRTQVQKRLDF